MSPLEDELDELEFEEEELELDVPEPLVELEELELELDELEELDEELLPELPPVPPQAASIAAKMVTDTIFCILIPLVICPTLLFCLAVNAIRQVSTSF